MQAEFTTAWKAGVDPDATAEELEQLWKSIDADGDGNLTVDELAKHFGFDAKSENSNEMSDEQILAALQLSMAVDEAASAEKKKLAEAEKAHQETKSRWESISASMSSEAENFHALTNADFARGLRQHVQQQIEFEAAQQREWSELLRVFEEVPAAPSLS